MSIQRACWAVAISLVLATPAAAQEKPVERRPPKDRTVPPDPLNDPMLITAGFLTHHQDLKYRLLGQEAYRKKNYEDALRFFRRASFFADKPSQGMVAEMYWNGDGTPVDRALAYAWMDLAAERSYTGFLGLRERYWGQLNEAERARAIEEGQAIYARFGDAAAKPRYQAGLRRGRNSVTGSRTGFNHGVHIEIPGPAGSQMIEGSKFYDERYWDAKKYWAWQDRIWAKPRIGKVSVGELESVPGAKAKDPPDTRIPEVRPEIDAQAPEVPDESDGTPPPKP